MMITRKQEGQSTFNIAFTGWVCGIATTILLILVCMHPAPKFPTSWVTSMDARQTWLQRQAALTMLAEDKQAVAQAEKTLAHAKSQQSLDALVVDLLQPKKSDEIPKKKSAHIHPTVKQTQAAVMTNEPRNAPDVIFSPIIQPRPLSPQK
jgi:hypothetical protein